MKKWWKLAFLIFCQFWWQGMGQLTSSDVSYQMVEVFVIIEMCCFCISNNFECHFEHNQKYQSNMDDPVDVLIIPASVLYKILFLAFTKIFLLHLVIVNWFGIEA